MTVLRSDGAPAGPLCRATDACKSSPRAKHCASCTSKARWEDPAKRQAMAAKVSQTIAANGRPPFRDERRVRQAVLYATAFGLAKAGEMLGIDPKKISLWRLRLERIEGKTYPRLPGRAPKLSLDAAREIYTRAEAGEKHEYLAAVYGVDQSTIWKVAQGILYPQAAKERDVAAWDALGSRGRRAA